MAKLKHSLPAFVDYFPPSVAALKARGGSLTIEEMEDEVARLMNLSEEQLAIPHGEGPRTQFQYVLAWVRTYLKKAGVAENSERGVWSLTDRGEQLTADEIWSIPERVNTAEAERRKLLKAQQAEVRTTQTDAGLSKGITAGNLGDYALEIPDWRTHLIRDRPALLTS